MLPPVKITAQPYKAIESAVAAGVGMAGVGGAGKLVWDELHREPGEPSHITKPKFAAFMGASIAGGVGVLVADKAGAIDRLATTANTAGRSVLLRGGAAALSGVALGTMFLAIPGMVASCGWGPVALLAPED